jgi:protein ImuB
MYACLYRPPAPDENPQRRTRGERRQDDVQNFSADSASSALWLLTPIAQAFSPRYERRGDDAVTIDVSGLDRLFGTPTAIGSAIAQDASQRGIRVHVTVAGTWTAAMMLAHARPGVTVIERGREAEALAPLAIEMLGAMTPEREAIAIFRAWGLKTLGEIAALPAADLAARLGQEGLLCHALAHGADLRPLIPDLAEERFDASLDLDWPIEGLEPLSFVLTRLLEPLSTRLERRDRGTAVLHVRLGLVTKEVHARRLELPAPIRDVRTLRTLALLDLESHPPGAAIDRVDVFIEPTPGRVLQHTLFTRAVPTPEQLSTLLARLGALMGQDRIGAPAVVDSYRPGAFAMRAFGTDHEPQRRTRGIRRENVSENTLENSACSVNSALWLCSALRRCRQPVPARVAVDGDRPVRVTTDRRGFAGGTVTHCAGPWRTSGEWWAGGAGGAGGAPRDKNWNRDEWDVALGDGAVYRIFRERDTGAWFIDAVID